MKTRYFSFRLLTAFLAIVIITAAFAPAIFCVSAGKTKVYAVGNGEGNWLHGMVWDVAGSQNLMTEVAADVYEITYEDVYGGFYQFKFALNGTWEENFGAPDVLETDPCESGATYDAKFNSPINIYFEVDEDGSSVTLRLDLSGYNKTTRKGAKFSVAVIPPRVTVEATSNFTGAVAQSYEDVQMYKESDGSVYITVEYGIKLLKADIVNFQFELTYDSGSLEFVEEKNKIKIGSREKLMIMPFLPDQGITGGWVINTDPLQNEPGRKRILANFSDLGGASAVDDDGSAVPFVKVTFRLIDSDAGIKNVDLDLENMAIRGENESGSNYHDIVDDSKLVDTDADFTMTASILPKEIKAIKTVQLLGYTAPVIGKRAGDFMDFSTPEGSDYYISNVYWTNATTHDWMSENDTFNGTDEYYATFEIRAKSDAFGNTVKVLLDGSEKLIDAEYTETSAGQVKAYTVNVTAQEASVLIGDLNSDGQVTSDDAVYLLRYTLFPKSYPVDEKYADFDHNEKVTSDDAIFLLRHTLFPDSYVLYVILDQ